jgi:NADH-quinone oxidoreductase subunit M
LVAAGFLLRSFQRAFLSQPGGDTSRWDTHPTYLTEKIMALTVMVVIVGVGFISAPWVELIEQPIHGLSSIFAPLAGDVEEGAQ